MVSTVDAKSRSQPVSTAHLFHFCSLEILRSHRFDCLLFTPLHFDQDSSQLEEHRLLQSHCLRWRRGVGVRLGKVQKRHVGFWSFQAQISSGLFQNTLAFKQVRAGLKLSDISSFKVFSNVIDIVHKSEFWRFLCKTICWLNQVSGLLPRPH